MLILNIKITCFELLNLNFDNDESLLLLSAELFIISSLLVKPNNYLKILLFPLFTNFLVDILTVTDLLLIFSA